MNLIDKLQQAFSNSACLDTFKTTLDIDNIQVDISSDGIEVSFMKENKLETLLVKPQTQRVGPKRRRTQTGIHHVAGYTMNIPKPDTEDLIKAQESDTDIEEKTNVAFQEFIECCLDSIDGHSITIE